jgi:hypothetical protein
MVVRPSRELFVANRCGRKPGGATPGSFPHGLRAAELCDLRWDQAEFNAAVLHVRRVKNDAPSTHPRSESPCHGSRRYPMPDGSLLVRPYVTLTGASDLVRIRGALGFFRPEPPVVYLEAG